MKSVRITKVFRIHPLGTTNVCISALVALHPVAVEIFQSRSVELTNQETDLAFHGSMLLA